MTLPEADTLSETTSLLPLRVGIIGCGWFGRVHVERLSALPLVHICAVSDPDEEARHRLAALVPDHALPAEGEVAMYADYREMLRSPGLDFVSINSPNRWHVEQVLASLEQGLHVLCEKPLSMIPGEVAQVVAATEQADRLVAISYQSRYRQTSRILREALQSGRWGKITSIMTYNQEDWLRPNIGTWRHDPVRCPGGFFADANGHQLDNIFWMTGLEATWVRATTEMRGTPVPMVTWGEARLRPQGGGTPVGEGVPMCFMFVGDAHHWREEICITTEQVDFVIRNGQLLWGRENAGLAPYPESEIDPALRSLPDLPDNAFVARLRGGPPIVSPPETVWPVLRFTLAGLASAEHGSAPQSTDAFAG